MATLCLSAREERRRASGLLIISPRGRGRGLASQAAFEKPKTAVTHRIGKRLAVVLVSGGCCRPGLGLPANSKKTKTKKKKSVRRWSNERLSESRTRRSAQFLCSWEEVEEHLVTDVTFTNPLNLRLLFSDTPLMWREPTSRIIFTNKKNWLPFVSHLVPRFFESLVAFSQRSPEPSNYTFLISFHNDVPLFFLF